jgi:hypothetical protein
MTSLLRRRYQVDQNAQSATGPGFTGECSALPGTGRADTIRFPNRRDNR